MIWKSEIEGKKNSNRVSMEISRFVTEAWTKNENDEQKLKISYSKWNNIEWIKRKRNVIVDNNTNLQR